ncbi:MAG TPA: hypothetical protein P5274_01605 [Candidatus Paceibacterota bacterium]|nr:hypothetical protein [Candidatus Paceibacterota bacterium]
MLAVFFLISPCLGLADSASSASYQIPEGVIAPAGYSTSSNFKLDGLISQFSIGQSQATDFILRSGLLYFPIISTPVVSVSAGDSQVSLSWTTATGLLGWNAGGYIVGWSSASGGPYSLIDAGLSTSYVKTSLSNGTTYYFVIKVKDALGNYVATSTQVSATPVATPVSPGGGGGSGGGGGTTPSGGARVVFSGRAFPLSSVSLFKDGQLVATTKAGPDANFYISIANLVAGAYNFGVNSIDSAGRQSLIQTFPVTLTEGASILVSGIFIAPSIAVDKQQVKQGDNIAIFGQSVPSGKVTIAVNSDNQIFAQAVTDKSGAYLYNLDTVGLEMGGHTAKSKATLANEISPFGPTAGFKVGTENILADAKTQVCPGRGDLNDDCKVNLVDFSIAAYWYKRPLTATFLALEKAKLNGDGKLNLTDFSIMAYYWTG